MPSYHPTTIPYPTLWMTSLCLQYGIPRRQMPLEMLILVKIGQYRLFTPRFESRA